MVFFPPTCYIFHEWGGGKGGGMNKATARAAILVGLLGLVTLLSCKNPIASDGTAGDPSARLSATPTLGTAGTLELFLSGDDGKGPPFVPGDFDGRGHRDRHHRGDKIHRHGGGHRKDFPLGDRQVTNVWVTILSIEAHGELSGWTTVFSDPQGSEYDLLKLAEDAEFLSSTLMKLDHYTQVRLVLGSGSRITLNGSIDYPLMVPSGEQTGLKIAGGFSIKENTTTTVVLDFDAQRSVKLIGRGRFLLKPVIHIEEVSYAPKVSENQPPVAVFNDPPIIGSTAIGGTLTASYSFSDPDGDAEAATTFQWFRFANSTDLTGGEAIAGATASSYATVDLAGNSDSGKWLRVSVTPADSAGMAGAPVPSGPVRVNTRIVIDTFPATGSSQNDTYLTLYQAVNGQAQVLAQDDNGFPNQATFVGYSRIDVLQGLPVGTYYVKVHKPTELGNPNYGFRVLDNNPGSVFPVVPAANETSDNDDAVGANGLPLNPVAALLGQALSRSIFPELTDVDWFWFQVQ